jgi:5-formyltetrahydrofolate cyclo-ligase
MTDQPSADSIDQQKAAVRAAALAARAALGPDVREAAAAAIATEGAAIVAREKPACVSLFFSVRGEIELAPLAQKLAEAGVPMCLPVIVAKGQPLVFRAWAPGDPLEDRRFGLKEPPASAPEVTPDLLFVPLAAFDATGARVGYGGGFYDRTLEKLRAVGPAMAVGVAFAAQQAPVVPTEAHDQRIDLILTENGPVIFP